MARYSDSGRSGKSRSSSSRESYSSQRSARGDRHYYNDAPLRSADSRQGTSNRVARGGRLNTDGNNARSNSARQIRDNRTFEQQGNRHRRPQGYSDNVGSGTRKNRINGATVLRDTVASNRMAIIYLILGVLALYLIGSLFLTQIVNSQTIQDRGSARVQTVTINAQRGTIYDRNGVVLATTVEAANIFCHPSKVPSDKIDELAELLAKRCGFASGSSTSSTSSSTSSTTNSTSAVTSSFSTGDGLSASDLQRAKEEYKEKLSTNNSSDFTYLIKLTDPAVAEEIAALNIAGIDYEQTTKRVYPCGSVGSQVIGILNSEGTAVSGLELYYDELLRGSDGKKEIEYSSDGFPVPGGTKVLEEKTDGKDIVVSLDIEMQRTTESALALRVETVQGDGGTALVMDSKTGEIYAASSSPTFDITDLSTIKDNAATTIRGISQAFEPGSIFKAVTMCAALEEGTTVAGQSYYCPESISVDEYTITDSHDRAAQTMDTSTIMAESSNIGLSLIASDLGWENLYNYIQKYQVTDLTGVDYPGENSGSISNWEKWSNTQGMNISFGQGLTVTPMEIVRFYGALANNGYACTPHFLLSVPADDDTRSYDSTEIIENKQSITDLTTMLEAVVEEGTGTDAQISGYDVAGKTGTAEVASDEGGYQEGVYNISFVGFIPNSSTNFVCFVGANNVPGERKTVSAFHDIMAFAIDRYNITQN